MSEEQYIRHKNEREYEVNITGTITLDVDETVGVFALNEEEAKKLAFEAIDVNFMAEEIARDFDYEVTKMEEE
jgi:hypothetical protein